MAPALSTATRNRAGPEFDFWACQRPLTSHWGSGQVLQRIRNTIGMPDVVFGKQDNIDGGVTTVDISRDSKPTVRADWSHLPFVDNQFEFAYWDPPFFHLDSDGKATLKPKLYKNEGMEIWRVSKRLAILHTHVWPRAWLERIAPAHRDWMVACTFGPMKVIRILQVFSKVDMEPIRPKTLDDWD